MPRACLGRGGPVFWLNREYRVKSAAGREVPPGP